MYPSAYDLKAFYNTLGGRIVRKALRERILEFWPADQQRDMRMLGVGYAVPYLRPYMGHAERVVSFMPPGQGAHHWPVDGKNHVAVAAGTDLPIETNSVDRILIVHSLEFSGFHPPLFEEIWRVLKSNGRLLILVPNRMGLWARADWSPFGQGTPFSARQVEDFLRDNLFTHERTTQGLFVPPFRRELFLRGAAYIESIGHILLPALGGMHIVEASKQIYAGTGKLARAKANKKAKPVPAMPQPIGYSQPD